MERSLAFWRDGLGMREIVRQDKQGGYFEAIVGEPDVDVEIVHLVFEDDGPRIELFAFRSPQRDAHVRRPADIGFSHVCVVCDDLDELLVRLVAAGGTPVSAPVEISSGVNRGGRALYVRDPDGHVLELFTPAAAR
jgi:lactoylglutathione lyase